MAKPDFNKFISALESRKKEERMLLLAVLLIIVGYAWLVLIYDRITAEQEQMNRNITALNAQIIEEGNRLTSIQQNYDADPNAFARNQQQELQQQTMDVDERLREMYGQLIQPRRMSEVLTTILQRETNLKLVSLQNQPSEMMASATAGAAIPLVGGGVAETEGALTTDEGIQVYQHGLSMVFEGDFIETIRYLRSLESLDNSFFWQSLKYDVVEWPRARITLDIYTLSTRQEWIGV